MITQVRQRVTRQLHQRRGWPRIRVGAPQDAAHRRNRLSRKQLARLTVLATDTTNDIGAAWPARSCSRKCRRARPDPDPQPVAVLQRPRRGEHARTDDSRPHRDLWPAILVAHQHHNPPLQQSSNQSGRFTNIQLSKRICPHRITHPQHIHAPNNPHCCADCRNAAARRLLTIHFRHKPAFCECRVTGGPTTATSTNPKRREPAATSAGSAPKWNHYRLR